MEGMHTFEGDMKFHVGPGEQGPVLRFLRDEEVITEIHLTEGGAYNVAVALLQAVANG